MPAAETHPTESPERERVERWRAELLERAGYDARSAAEVATRQDIDVHFAIDLLEQGCSPELALKILL
jgi:hypothetical protein